jgi:hypothetical protein
MKMTLGLLAGLGDQVAQLAKLIAPTNMSKIFVFCIEN